VSADAIAFLFSLERLGMKFGLEQISALCDALDHPERSFQSVIIAGTNGKGSVTAMVDTALGAAGHRTGRYTSPHLTRLEERFAINGTEVATDTLRAAAGRVQQTVVSMQARGLIEQPPTFFECTTAVAFELFRDASVDLAVLEVGLGGRLDATNVVTPIVAAITSIDLDHEAQLGSSLEAIAHEKAGVIKEGIPVVCGRLPTAADRVIADVCAERGATLVRALEVVQVTRQGAGIEFRSRRRTLGGIHLGLAGSHQIDNAAVAIAVLDALDLAGIRVDDGAVRRGLVETRWPGRLERLSKGPTEILLDAAHNPAGARALASYLHETGWMGITIVFGAMRDKDVAAMLGSLVPFARTIVCTTPPSPRAMPAADVAAMAAAEGATAEIVDDPAAALARACELDTRVLVAGSIFLIGALRDILR
jgi:dihydrofolate synthase/folylpolyglutamate synthase